MKWIVILTTLLAFAAPLVHADEEMPLGDTNVSSALASPSTDVATPTPTSKPKSKTNKSTTDRKVTDYAPAQDLLLSAMSLIGVKYTWGGNTPESGLDCSGFIRYVFQNSMNMTLPRTALGMAQTGKSIDKSDLKPGDLVFFNTLGRTFSHVGIYLGDNRFIHSPRAGRSVEIANMGISYWTTRFTGARRMSEGGADGLDINTMLAKSSSASRGEAPVASATRSNARSPAATEKCRKVTTGKGKKKKTVTQCSRVTEKKAAVSNKVAKKPAPAAKSKSAKTSKLAKTMKAAKSSKPTATPKKSSKSVGKPAPKTSNSKPKPK